MHIFNFKIQKVEWSLNLRSLVKFQCRPDLAIACIHSTAPADDQLGMNQPISTSRYERKGGGGGGFLIV